MGLIEILGLLFMTYMTLVLVAVVIGVIIEKWR